MSTIVEFFKGRNVFVTGATGFMGKVLIEKLVRSCPDIGKICILVRQKKGKDTDARIKEILNAKLFDTIKEQRPGLMEEKLFPILGDMTELRLGLSDIDYNFLVENVSVVFHVAASVRFDEPIRDATLMNVRGTREVVQLSKQMKNLKVFLHVSTAYCNCIREHIEEKIYEAPFGWREAISIAENIDSTMSSILTKKLLGKYPNTYTLTKLLAEQIINEEAKNMPMVIFRPTIVISTINDPIKGWIDNFNGPIGLMVAVGKGVVRVAYSDKMLIADYIPVDISIKSMIVAAWHRSQSNLPEDNPIPIYNSASSSTKTATNVEILDFGMKIIKKYPFEEMLWLPGVIYTTCIYYYYLTTIIKQVLPAIFLDMILYIIGKPPKRLLLLQQKIYVIQIALSYFTTKTWKFENKNFLGLIDKIPDIDRKEFDYDFKDLDVFKFFEDATIGSQKYLFNVDMKRLPIARRVYRRFVWLDKVFTVIGYSIFALLLVHLLIQFNIIPSTLVHSMGCCLKWI
ncbi:putative fatty acyl-CoA reductase CG5065 [Sipha flava]|uniref:Fatty acyl-CoA reductase n=1 Tax=Sipha flava TaxID=143950 RepID=A0A2S2Q9S1_9HEMI|nr:putative fatty acyl-CoA reductase CG5065 [Sipha flava]